MTPRSPLRDLTRAEHEAVDALFSRFDLAGAAGYRSFLAAMARAHLAIEAQLDEAGAARVIDDWADRRRGHLLRADLVDLGADARLDTAPLALGSDPAILGTIYVLEGSRLGGAVLSRGLPAGAPARFLGAPARPGAWQRLLSLLDDRLDTPAALGEAADAARACFARFERAASSQLEPLIA